MESGSSEQRPTNELLRRPPNRQPTDRSAYVYMHKDVSHPCTTIGTDALIVEIVHICSTLNQFIALHHCVFVENIPQPIIQVVSAITELTTD